MGQLQQRNARCAGGGRQRYEERRSHHRRFVLSAEHVLLRAAGAKCCGERLRTSVGRLCLSVRLHISKTTCPNFTKKLLCTRYVWTCRGSGVCWRQYNALCTSSFVDNIMFAHSGLYGAWQRKRMVKITPLPEQYMVGWVMMSTTALFSYVFFVLKIIFVQSVLYTRLDILSDCLWQRLNIAYNLTVLKGRNITGICSSLPALKQTRKRAKTAFLHLF